MPSKKNKLSIIILFLFQGFCVFGTSTKIVPHVIQKPKINIISKSQRKAKTVARSFLIQMENNKQKMPTMENSVKIMNQQYRFLDMYKTIFNNKIMTATSLTVLIEFCMGLVFFFKEGRYSNRVSHKGDEGEHIWNLERFYPRVFNRGFVGRLLKHTYNKVDDPDSGDLKLTNVTFYLKMLQDSPFLMIFLGLLGTLLLLDLVLSNYLENELNDKYLAKYFSNATVEGYLDQNLYRYGIKSPLEMKKMINSLIRSFLKYNNSLTSKKSYKWFALILPGFCFSGALLFDMILYLLHIHQPFEKHSAKFQIPMIGLGITYIYFIHSRNKKLPNALSSDTVHGKRLFGLQKLKNDNESDLFTNTLAIKIHNQIPKFIHRAFSISDQKMQEKRKINQYVYKTKFFKFLPEIISGISGLILSLIYYLLLKESEVDVSNTSKKQDDPSQPAANLVINTSEGISFSEFIQLLSLLQIFGFFFQIEKAVYQLIYTQTKLNTLMQKLSIYVNDSVTIPDTLNKGIFTGRIKVAQLVDVANRIVFIPELILEPNKKYCIVGPSGSGKSTLLKLLMKGLEASKNSILFEVKDPDNSIRYIPIEQISDEKLFKQTAILSQDTHLFSDNIFQNITFGETMNKSVIIHSLKRHNLYDSFVKFHISEHIREQKTKEKQELSSDELQIQTLELYKTIKSNPTLENYIIGKIIQDPYVTTAIIVKLLEYLNLYDTLESRAIDLSIKKQNLISPTLELREQQGIYQTAQRNAKKMMKNDPYEKRRVHHSMIHDIFLENRGMNLSGGQQKKIVVARVLFHTENNNAKRMIMDEADSALDPESIVTLYSMLKSYDDAVKKLDALIANKQENHEENQDKLTIIVTHNLSVAKNFDVILVMNQGQIVESGSYDELIKMKGLFKKMLDFSDIYRSINEQCKDNNEKEKAKEKKLQEEEEQIIEKKKIKLEKAKAEEIAKLAEQAKALGINQDLLYVSKTEDLDKKNQVVNENKPPVNQFNSSYSQPNQQVQTPKIVQPGYNPNQPGYNPNQPGYNPNQPGYNPNQPGYNPNQPGSQNKLGYQNQTNKNPQGNNQYTYNETVN
jgi:ABC-type multidrug transport system fused ATPase/permease subunit